MIDPRSVAAAGSRTPYTESDRAVYEAYVRFFERFSPARHAAYLAALPPEITARNPLATTPVFMARSRYRRLARLVQAVVALLRQPAYQESARARLSGHFLRWVPLREADYFGAVDVHVDESQEKIIEVNLVPPGFVSFAERLEAVFLSELQPGHEPLLRGFEDRLVDAVTERGAYTHVAIVGNQLSTHHRRSEMEYLRTLLSKTVTATIESAESRGAPLPARTRVFNRVIPSDWSAQRDALVEYTALFAAFPDNFFPNPNGWYVADKHLLCALDGLEDRPFGVDVETRDALQAGCLRTRLLSTFSSAEALASVFPHRRLVIKPMDQYGGRDVLFRPSVAQQRRLLDEAGAGPDRVVQALCPAGTIPYVLDHGRVTEPLKFDLRFFFLNGDPVGALARIYSGAITNFRGVGGIAPVLVV